MPFGAKGADEAVGRLFVWEDADHFLSTADLLDEALQHIGRAQPAPIIWRQGQDGSRLFQAAFQHLKSPVSSAFEFGACFAEGLAGALRRGGLQDSIEQLVHAVADRGRRPIEDVSSEVGLTPLPDEPWEGGLQRLAQGFVGVASGNLHAREAAALKTLDKAASRFAGLAERHVQPQNVPLALIADAHRKQDRCLRAHRALPADLHLHPVKLYFP